MSRGGQKKVKKRGQKEAAGATTAVPIAAGARVFLSTTPPSYWRGCGLAEGSCSPLDKRLVLCFYLSSSSYEIYFIIFVYFFSAPTTTVRRTRTHRPAKYGTFEPGPLNSSKQEFQTHAQSTRRNIY